MKKLFVLLFTAIILLAPSSFGRGSFSSGRSSFSSGRSSFSSGRSSFSGRSSSGRGSAFGNSSSSRSSTYTRSGRGWFGGRASNNGKFGNGNIGTAEKPRYTARSVLEDSPATFRTRNGRSLSVYSYYYPGRFYGSGYSFYHWYFWYHFFGNHRYCYHKDGGKQEIRACKVSTDCTAAESCDLKTNTCKLKEGTW